MAGSTPPCEDLDPTVSLLRRLFACAGAPLLAGVLVGACGSEGGAAPGGGQGGASGPTCVNGTWVPTSGLSLPHDVDYASLRSTTAGSNVAIRSASGKPCALAERPELCLAEIDQLSVRHVKADGSSYLLTTDGDTVRSFQTLADKLMLLGAIDTPDEALLIAEHAGYPIDCRSLGAPNSNGYDLTLSHYDPCGDTELERFELRVSRDGVLNVVSSKVVNSGGCVAGRRPPGLRDNLRQVRARSAMGRYFARAAHLEAASVDAFEIMERELALAGLPRALREALRSAAEDETRHARDTSRLAAQFGGRPQTPELKKQAVRGLAELAFDNAIEGCVSETYAAYVTTLQAAYARDPVLKAVLSAIAEDETRHAALSWQLAAWMEPQLESGPRRKLATQRHHAIMRLGRVA